MSFKGFSIFSSGGQFVQRSKTILAFSVEGHLEETFLWNYFEISPLV